MIFFDIFLARFENCENQNATFQKKAEKMAVFDTFLHFFALFHTFVQPPARLKNLRIRF